MTREGFVYVMRSQAVNWCKIGLSECAPHFRAKVLSADTVYGPIGPWSEVDFRQVQDRSAAETALHRCFARHRCKFETARELFDVSADEACAKLRDVVSANLVRGDLVAQMKLDPGLVAFLLDLFRVTGLNQFSDLQEAWTFSLFPSTSGGRFSQ